eukprot:COSAG01_NODE_16812_length_1202_cov_1.003626_1_plen_39_part_10
MYVHAFRLTLSVTTAQAPSFSEMRRMYWSEQVLILLSL